jgi:hypothetical protein
MQYPLRGILLLTVLVSVAPLGDARALGPLLETGGGGSSRTDCYATFKATLNVPASRPRRVRCVDGDAACDADGIINGQCAFPVAVCANSTLDPARCTPTGVESLTVLHSDDNGLDPAFDPDLQGLQDAVDAAIAPPTAETDLCTEPSTVSVRIKGPVGKPLRARDRCRRNGKIVRLSTLPQPLVGASDSDRLKLVCLPADADVLGCDAKTLFGSTFDRLQKQIFSTSCGVATCHDSESFPSAADLLLEPGAAYANLVGQPPTNGPALGLGWQRVAPGSAATSFLYHKVTNDLDDAAGLGDRMPRPPGRRMLHPSLREVIRLWIDAGAPETGWVDDTF